MSATKNKAPDWVPTDAEAAAIAQSREAVAAAKAAHEAHVSTPSELPPPKVIEGQWARGIGTYSAADLAASRIEHGTGQSDPGRLTIIRNALAWRAEAAAKAVLPDRPELALAAVDALRSTTRANLEARLIAPVVEVPSDGKPRLIVQQEGGHTSGDLGSYGGTLHFRYLRTVEHAPLTGEAVSERLTDADWTINAVMPGGTSSLDDDHVRDSFTLEVRRGYPRVPLIVTMPDDHAIANAVSAALAVSAVRYAHQFVKVHGGASHGRAADTDDVIRVEHEVSGNERRTVVHVATMLRAPAGNLPLLPEHALTIVNGMVGHVAVGRIESAELIGYSDLTTPNGWALRIRTNAVLVSRVPS